MSQSDDPAEHGTAARRRGTVAEQQPGMVMNGPTPIMLDMLRGGGLRGQPQAAQQMRWFAVEELVCHPHSVV